MPFYLVLYSLRTINIQNAHRHDNIALITTNCLYCLYFKGLARTQTPTITNYALDLPTFGVIAGVNPTEVQWKGLALEDRPC